MENNKPFLEVLQGRKTDRIPFWFMRQAGRYLPEYRELRSRKNGFLDMAFDSGAACEITLQPIRRFGMDAAIIFSDILVIPYALGQRLEFLEGEGPKLERLRTGADIAKLNPGLMERKLSPVYEAIAKVSSKLDDKTALIGFAGAPWTVATYMVEGGGSKDFIAVKKMAYSDPQTFAALIDLLVESTAHYLIRQVEAGAEALQIFDSWSGVLDSDEFRKWVIQPTKQIVDLVRDSYPQIPIIGFPKGAGYNYMAYAEGTGVNVLGLDSQVPTKWAARVLQPLKPVQGNLDPIALLAGGDAMKLAAERIIADLSSGPFVFNLGHGIHKDTPVEHVEQLVKMIRS
ncbi:MAG TPA: uroporphyrinogen decarboxylase [Rhodospirillaceae bacterium]|nr:uroporphyrinogen decarboxylase [Rhodospirillaceae bacterium]